MLSSYTSRSYDRRSISAKVYLELRYDKMLLGHFSNLSTIHKVTAPSLASFTRPNVTPPREIQILLTLRNEVYFYSVAGARMMYRYLPKSVGLRRITLHKSMSQGDKMYLLICECSQLQDNLSAAAILLPALRARLCGYIGLYRPSVCF